MSFENAILVHAAALEKLAEAIRSVYGANVALVTAPADTAGSTLIQDKAAELATATQTRAATAKASTAADAKANAAAQVKPDADLEQAVAKVEEKAKTEQIHSPDDADLSGPLDYLKDVRPVLLAAIKKAGKDKVQALINTFGVDKADKIDPAKFSELLAGAQKLAA